MKAILLGKKHKFSELRKKYYEVGEQLQKEKQLNAYSSELMAKKRLESTRSAPFPPIASSELGVGRKRRQQQKSTPPAEVICIEDCASADSGTHWVDSLKNVLSIAPTNRFRCWFSSLHLCNHIFLVHDRAFFPFEEFKIQRGIQKRSLPFWGISSFFFGNFILEHFLCWLNVLDAAKKALKLFF